MYFIDHLPPDWDLKDLFYECYQNNNQDFSKTLLSIKCDLNDLITKPTVLKSVKSAAEKCISRWTKLTPKFKAYAQEYEASQQVSPEANQMSNITNIITNQDQAVFNQTNNVISVSGNGTNSLGNKRQNEGENQFLFEKIDANDIKNDNKSWIIGENSIDIGNQFKKYQVSISEHVQSKDILIETNTQEILALSNIFLIKDNQETPLFRQFFPQTYVDLVKDEIKKKFNIKNYRLESSKKTALEDIIFDLRQGIITTRSAVKKITVAISDDEDNKIDMLILGVRNLVESLPRSKFNGPLRESNLSCSYIHCILNPIFTAPEKNAHLMWLNTQIVKESDKQPDFVGNFLIGLQFEGPAVVGDVKGEDRKDDISPCLLDLIRIGILSGESINENGYDGVIGIHVVGVQVTCFIISLMAPGFYVMLEICTITLPKDFTEIRSYIVNMEDLLPVLHYYKKCTNTSNKDSIKSNSRKMMDSSTLKIITGYGKNRKRPCNIVYNH